MRARRTRSGSTANFPPRLAHAAGTQLRATSSYDRDVSKFAIVPLAPEATRAVRQAVLRPHQSLDELAEDEAPGTHAVGAYADGELVAVGLVAPDGESGGWRMRGMAAVPAVRGRGAGTAVLQALLDHARARGATRIWCDARTPALSLYERAGLRAVSEVFELPRIGPHVVMEWRAEAAGQDADAALRSGATRSRASAAP
jgi:GNAT superfamily N-acetyltransferase